MQAVGVSAVLGLETPGIVAIAGSGGKTTLLYRLAVELSPLAPVVVTTTTHILPPEAGKVAQVWMLAGAAPARDEVDARLAAGGPLAVVDRRLPDGKLAGLGPEQLAPLADGRRWVLVEADGSARLPLKAWAAHEPAVPPQAAEVLLVVGASGLGRPLDPARVHRPELFASGAGIQAGEEITPRALARLIFSPAGPLDRLPREGRRQLIINQVDAAPAGLLRRLAERLEEENHGAGPRGFKHIWWARLRNGWIGELSS